MENQYQQTNIKERVQKVWTDFGPLILGAMVLLVIVGGGWYIWRSRTVTIPTPTPSGTVEIVEDLPSSEINLAETPEPSVTPTPVASATPPATPVVVAKGGQPSDTTKGGLPATGAPIAPIIFSAALLATGFVLRKTSKKT
ncbi:MAG: hypothetical protein A3D24_00110 [Candidatus Blackburnbacteria bacterium RIFCSPHIGHO2_02_FULL_39_13]|uniref:Gram-positive cocci surface proteins LPxTG domain-containing protein n=1 Tax=Candidatus Blackburnbacteria bacterium RIFCSPLOWO2_01_FULL_40_20 TaxID=1797519 RepID=A0A1G1VEZ6_9BACT|nr:MAG: hypothetical protein UT38_C0016G0016 [Microgenomates group bacterium GW2011_GWA2_39_19]OGY07187.1 MAG: hypothetical protein A2694_01360 [Candidatus Blackburnbacteria bacterium RIFCSPHIGHO2_01_FULL_40_17]OGY08282.1 MAG: hypothetical protein A3D24_00110 [Candidatus Blackburnbacteria bacterium RIFCSPHIGHO2_02_FULL_39_13]OGY13941.1 MAG: hypothetical protein A3A77_04050 [Candidatus Blackburnbacteria bacterium RIFCSPLOWO2_01_FULL_40_20]OGY15567.1 MAG: hypothetical protein A3I52_03020 [Candida